MVQNYPVENRKVENRIPHAMNGNHLLNAELVFIFRNLISNIRSRHERKQGFTV